MEVFDKQEFVRRRLSDHYSRTKVTNPSFSVRSFARRLGISVSTYSEFGAGKRYLSDKLLVKIISKLNLPETDMAMFEQLPLKRKKTIRARSNSYHDLTPSGLDEQVKDPTHFQNILMLEGSNSLLLFMDDKSRKEVEKHIENLTQKIAHILERQVSSPECKPYVWKCELSDFFDDTF